MKGNDKKILLVSDYSNFHSTLAKGLRRIGCDVTLVSNRGTFMQCDCDILLRRKWRGKIGGLVHTVDAWQTILRKLRDFDIVSMRDPLFLELKPEKCNMLFNLIARLNPNIFLTYLTTDLPFINMIEAEDSPLRYSEWFIDGKPNDMYLQERWKWEEWHSEAMAALNNNFYGKIKGAVTALYEYHKSAERVFPKDKFAYGGIPIDVESIPHTVIDRPEKIRIFIVHDYRRKFEKGAHLLEEAARRVRERHPDKMDLVMVENVPRKTYLDLMQSSHILLDQVYSYTPATAALEAMAAGLTVVSGAEPEYYDFIGETENFPLVNAPVHPEALESTIEYLVTHPEDFAERSRRGRAFVEKHNNLELVASRFLDFWLKNV